MPPNLTKWPTYTGKIKSAASGRKGERADNYDYVDTYLTLRQVMMARRALLILDGIDETGQLRHALEQHMTEVLAPQGHLLVVTSRPTGLPTELYHQHRFMRLQLCPLSLEAQVEVAQRRHGPFLDPPETEVAPC